ncbi:DUF2238 domain-containing protein [Candidatus Pacearchaeota archaeon]|nr:DUF2238 domain-containing protein [Candidatus Pacearchaeota archaeon]
MRKRELTLYHGILFALFLAVWIWAAINPTYRSGWLLENYLVFIFVPIILISGIYFKLSKISYTLITLFMILHVIGGHYTYSEVPFGYTLQDWFNSTRNMYDRLVHFSFGLLIAYPVREIFMRLSRARGFWSYWFPIELTLAFSAVFELIEWLAAINTSPELGLAYLGAQGDIWDAQKDMALAGLGSIITMFITALIRLPLDKNFWREFKSSLFIPRHDAPLGEIKLSELIKKSKARGKTLGY